MEIDGFSSSGTPTVDLEPPPPPVSEPSSVSEEPPTTEDEELPGVIRHLMEGHYKGVSQLRLQINFADVLAAIEQEQIQAAAAEQIDNMLGAIGETIEGLFGTPEETEGAEEELVTAAAQEPTLPEEGPAEEPPTEEQSAAVMQSQGSFVLAVDLSEQDFMTAQPPSQDTLLEGLNDAFDTFVTSLTSVFQPEPVPELEPEPESEGTGGGQDATVETQLTEGAEGDIVPQELTAESDPPAETDPPPESEFDYQGFIEGLANTFLLAIAELVNAMDAVNILPELSEPSGNGGAYAKFLTIYDGMQGSDEQDAAAGVDEPLDAVL